MAERKIIYEQRPTDDRVAAIMWDWFSTLNRRLDYLEVYSEDGEVSRCWTGKYSIGTFVHYDEDDQDGEGEFFGNCLFFQTFYDDSLKCWKCYETLTQGNSNDR